MNAKDFGKLVAALRKELEWEQKDLSKKSELELYKIQKVEEGVYKKITKDLLLGLAKGLNLTSRERRELFYAGSKIDENEIARPQQDPIRILEEQKEIISKIGLPVILTDVYGDTIFANAAIINLLGATQDMINKLSEQTAGFHILRVIFDKSLGFRERVGSANNLERWEGYAKHNVATIRAQSLRYRFRKSFTSIFNKLKKIDDDFLRFWQDAAYDEKDYYSTSLNYRYSLKNLGELNYFTASSITVTSFGELNQVVYLPATKNTSDAFNRLANMSVPQDTIDTYAETVKEREIKEVYQLGKWPKFDD